jgi:triosephosphate isomerase (TIM)
MNKLVIGNWKMHGDALEVHEFMHAMTRVPLPPDCAVGIAVPCLHLPQLAALIGRRPVAIVAQDVSQFGGSGAFTGEVSASMLHEAGCEYVLIGHSERRQYFAEGEAVLAQKLIRASEAGLVPVLCVGETQHDRRRGDYLQVLEHQLEVLNTVADSLPPNIWIAYEPVWAIGTGLVAKAEQIVEVHAHLAHCLRERLPSGCAARLLYGGSVKAGNASEILALPGVDGVLVGSASLAAAEFSQIIAGAEAAA